VLVPYTVDVPMARLPLANWILIAVTFVISLAIIAGVGRGGSEPAEDDLDAILRNRPTKGLPGHAIAPVLGSRERDAVPPLALRPGAFSFGQLFTHLFVHANVWHLLANMLFLFCFGNAVNAKFGHGLYLLSYLLIGALAGAGWMLLGDTRPCVGASGAIMGVMGIFFVLFPKNEVRIFYWWGPNWVGAVGIAAVWLITFYMLCDLLGTLIDGGGAVGYVAHLVGAVLGIGTGLVLVRTGMVGATEYEENLLQMMGFQAKLERNPDPVPLSRTSQQWEGQPRRRRR
jgi:membrane associated rhomboid family serine protease